MEKTTNTRRDPSLIQINYLRCDWFWIVGKFWSYSYQPVKAPVSNFGVNINKFLCSIWKKCHNTRRQLDHQISAFSHASVFRIIKNPFTFRSICPISDAVCTLCPYWLVYALLLGDIWLQNELISCSCLMHWLAFVDNRVSASDTVSRLKPELWLTCLLCCKISSWLELDLKERATTNEIKRELEQTGAAELLPNHSHVTANISSFSLLASYQMQL